jgi:hypothetical protein
MISKADVEELRKREVVSDSPVLSVYLDVDQGKASNLNRHFEAVLKDLLRSIETQLDKKQLDNFAADAERVQDFVSRFEPGGKGLIIFCDDSENFWWAHETIAVETDDGRTTLLRFEHVPLVETERQLPPKA